MVSQEKRLERALTHLNKHKLAIYRDILGKKPHKHSQIHWV
jgi:hypothetical protein